MSGAEILFGVGILCNAMQIVTFGRDALQIYRHVRDGGAPDQNLDSYLVKATANYREMKDQLVGSKPLSTHHQQIVSIGEEAYNGLLEFRGNFDSLHIDEGSRRGLRGRLRVAKSGFKTLWRAKDLEDLEKNFQRHEQLLQTRLIHRTCSQADAIELLSQESFRDLNISIQHVVLRLSEGHREISELVSQQAVDIKAHGEQQHEATRSTVNQILSATQNNLQSRISESTSIVQQHIASRTEAAENKKQHDQLLASLRYPEMNSRRNQVEANYSQTFQWIFSAEDSTSSSDSTANGERESGDESSVRSTEGADGIQQVLDQSLTINDTDSNSSSVIQPTPFTGWLRDDSKMFWISGKPASGKSTLMKFIISNPLTIENLRIWHSNAQILTHYFWMAGTAMEKSVRGMVLSLLHQVLLKRYDLSQRLLAEKSFVHEKWSHHDWASQELEEVLCWVLRSAEGAFCIFLDGLDESVELGRTLWMPDRSSNILGTLTKLKDVKICASSREEDAFCHYFEGSKRLRIHELTQLDLRQFANQRLEGLTFADPKDRDTLLYRVVSKADGVFLWVALVLDSIARGIRAGNDIETLIERVQHTPTDIKQLFEDMWKRSGDDGDMGSHRACASRYLCFAMPFGLGLVGDYAEWGSRAVLDFAIAAENQPLESLLDAKRDINVDGLSKKCSKAEAEIRAVCHGLLEITNDHDFGYRQCQKSVVPESLNGYNTMKVQFVHRCAIDFLRDTETGAMLLNACKWSTAELYARVLACIMIKGRIAKTKRYVPDFDKIIGSKRYIGYHKYLTCLDRVLGYIDEVLLVTQSPYKDLFTQSSKQWQLEGLFLDQALWTYPGRSLGLCNLLENEFLESIALKASTSDSDMIRLVRQLPVERFVNSINVVIRGLSKGSLGHFEYQSYMRRLGVTEAILSRLLDLGEAETITLSNDSRRSLFSLLYSWFVSMVMSYHAHDSGSGSEFHAFLTLAFKIVRLFIVALPSAEDWDQQVSLYLILRQFSCRIVSPMEVAMPDNILCWDCYVVVDFSTAYRIMMAMAWKIVCRRGPQFNFDEVMPNVLKGTRPCFEPLLISIGAERPVSFLELEQSFCAVRPGEQDDIAAILLHSLLTGCNLTEDEMLLVRGLSLIHGPRRSEVARNMEEAVAYLIGQVGHVEGLPMHPWTPGWVIEEQSLSSNS